MSYTYPHFVSQSPAASYESVHSVTQYMEEHFGPREPGIPENEDVANDLADIHDTHESNRRRNPIPYHAITRTYGSIPKRTSVASLGPSHLPLERAPLLGNDHERPLTITNRSPETSELPRIPSSDFSGPVLLQEAMILLHYAVPILIAQLLEYSLSVAAVISIGHRSTPELAASTLGSMTASVTGYSILFGMVSALDSLLPQAWGGPNSQKKLVGLWSLRMGVVLSFTIVPVFFVWMSSHSILLLLRQHPEVAQYASLFLRWLSLGLPAFAFNTVARKFYQSIGLIHIPSVIILIVAPLNALLNYILVWGPGPFQVVRLNFIGAPIATAVSFNLMTLLYGVHLIKFAPREAWYPLNCRRDVSQVFSVEALGLLVRLGIAGVGQTASEWWSWELIGLAASQLGPVALASQSVLLVSASTSWQFPFSMATATSVRVGNLLGAGDSNRARMVARLSLVLIVLITTFSSTIFLVFRHSWAYLFNNDIRVVKMVAHVLPLVALFQALDGLSAVSMILLRVIGRQYTGAMLNVTGYYVIGIPLGLALTFYFTNLHLGLLGLWLGLSVALAYVASIGVVILLRADWALEVERIRLRLKEGTDE